MSTEHQAVNPDDDASTLRWLEESLTAQESDESQRAIEHRAAIRTDFLARFRETYPSYDHGLYTTQLARLDGIDPARPGQYLTEVMDEVLEFTQAIQSGIPDADQIVVMDGYKLELAAALQDDLGPDAFWLFKMIDFAYPSNIQIAQCDQAQIETMYVMHFGRTLAQVEAFKSCLGLALMELAEADTQLKEVTPTKEVAQELSRLAMSHGMLEGRALWENDRFGALPLDTLMRRGRLNQIKQESLRSELETLIGYHSQTYRQLPEVFAQISSSIARVVITALDETMAT